MAIIGQHSHLGCLLGNQCRLPLGQDHNCTDKLNGPGDGSEKREGSKGFVKGNTLVVWPGKSTFAIRIRSQYVVVEEQVGCTQCLCALSVANDRVGVSTNLVVR